MTRAELQRLARDRLRDAKHLLTGRRWAAAYYLTGYAVECALKSCIIAHLMRTDDFPARRYSEQCWTHDLEQLVELADLEADLAAATAGDPDLKDNWNKAKDWDESTRYTWRGKVDALALYRAITDNKHGVLRWLKSRW
jgi:HEPN domain-containing protein